MAGRNREITVQLSPTESVRLSVPEDMKVKDANGLPYGCCPTCSRMYALVESGAAAELPGKCKRCGGPMDAEKAWAYGEQLAERDHQPALTALGNRMRALAGTAEVA